MKMVIWTDTFSEEFAQVKFLALIGGRDYMPACDCGSTAVDHSIDSCLKTLAPRRHLLRSALMMLCTRQILRRAAAHDRRARLSMCDDPSHPHVIAPQNSRKVNRTNTRDHKLPVPVPIRSSQEQPPLALVGPVLLIFLLVVPQHLPRHHAIDDDARQRAHI